MRSRAMGGGCTQGEGGKGRTGQNKEKLKQKRRKQREGGGQLAHPSSCRSSPSPALKNSVAPSCRSLARSFLAAQLNLHSSVS